MSWIRSIPLFVRIGLAWWVVLIVDPFSRPFMLFASFDGYQESVGALGLPALVGLGSMSLLNAMGVAWVVVRVMKHLDVRRDFGSLVAWTFFISWLAVASWVVVAYAVWTAQFIRSGSELGSALSSIPSLLFSSLFVYPMLAFTLFWKATFILWPLAAVTVMTFRHEMPQPVELDSLGRPRQGAG